LTHSLSRKKGGKFLFGEKWSAEAKCQAGIKCNVWGAFCLLSLFNQACGMNNSRTRTQINRLSDMIVFRKLNSAERNMSLKISS